MKNTRTRKTIVTLAYWILMMLVFKSALPQLLLSFAVKWLLDVALQ